MLVKMTDLKTEASGDVVSPLGPASLHSARIGTNDVEPTRVFVGNLDSCFRSICFI